MRIQNWLVLLICSASLFSCSGPKSNIRISIESEMKLHPESHLVDLYKYFFQDYFGPGPLLGDTAKSRRYIDYELENAKSFEDFDHQPLLYKKQFSRVNLSTLVNGKISQEQLLDAFYRSAEKFKIPDVNIWKTDWDEIMSHIMDMNLNLPDFKEERQMIDSVLNSGKYVIHHSEQYIETYDPHYRIIHVDELESLKLLLD